MNYHLIIAYQRAKDKTKTKIELLDKSFKV